MPPTLAELRARRAFECRLTKERALASLEEAEAFLRDRRVLTQTLDSALPSLFVAIHEAPYAPGRSGFGSWPKTKWWWGSDLASRPEVQPVKVHKGKVVLLSAEAAAVADPLCRRALSRAEDGELGPDAAAIVRALSANGPSGADRLRAELAMSPPTFRAAREKLEREGAVVSRATASPGRTEGHRQSSTLARCDQSFTQRRKAQLAAALDELVLICVRAAVVVQEDEPRAWLSWPVPADTIARLLASRKLMRPAAGWVAAA